MKKQTNGTGRTRAVIYVRVSTEEQAEKGYSIQSQIDACLKYAHDNGLAVVGEPVIDEYTGAELDRPGLNQVRELIANRSVQAVVVYTSDRLTRNLAHSLLLREEWRRAGIDLYRVSHGKIEDTPEDRLTENIEGVIAEYEREKTRERTRRGKFAKAKSGRLVLAGRLAYGYRREGKGHESIARIFEPEARIVRLIFKWYTLGDKPNSKPLSLQEIAYKLQRRGMPTPKAQKGKTTWIPATVRNILRNEIYRGQAYFGMRASKKENGKLKHVLQPRESWIAIAVPDLAVIDRATYDAAAKRLQRNKELSQRNRKHEYLLSGFIRCGTCGWAMVGQCGKSHGESILFYSCGRKLKHERCQHAISAKRAEEAVWGWLHRLLSSDRNLREGLQEMSKGREAELGSKRDQLRTLEDLLGKVERKINRLVEAFSDETDSTVAKALRAQMKEASQQRDALQTEYNALASEIEQTEIAPETYATILKKAAKVRARLDKATFENKRYLLDALDVRVTLRDDKKGRWLDVSCGFETTNIELRSSR
jgi:site-specific DNA recombinase